MARVDLHRLTKRFNNLTAVDDLEISIADGEFVTLLGPSGCGKSTALACIAGLEAPTAGTIAFDGADVTERAPAERNIALVFQDYALYPHMNVRDNITFGLRQQRLEEKTIRNQVAAAAEMLDLGGLLERRPSELSGGQRQRVAVGRAVVRNPAVLLMDEPLSNLDAGLRVNTRTEIKRLQREINTTTVFVTHDQEEAMVLSDRIAVIRLGKLQQIGPPMDVYRRPINIFVAGFIGSPAMNFFPVEISRESNALVCMIGAQRIELPLEGISPMSLAAMGKMRKVVLGVRPTDLIAGARRGSTLSGQVFLVEPIGHVTYLDVDIDGHRIKGIAEPDEAPAPGENVRLGFQSGRVHLFDPETGLRL